MSNYTDEERAHILAAGRAAIEAAEETLAKPRPELWPAVEDKLAKWKREANEQSARFAAERREWPLTDTEAAQLAHDKLAGQLGEQKEFLLQIVAGVVAEERHAFEQKIAELSAEVGQLRAERTLDRALAKGEPGDVIDLPALPLRRRAS